MLNYQNSDSCWWECKKGIIILGKMAISQKAKHIHTLWPKVLLQSIYPHERKAYVHKKTRTRIFIGLLFKIAPNWKQPKCLTTDKWWTMCGILIPWNTTQQYKGKNCWHWNHMDEYQEHYASGVPTVVQQKQIWLASMRTQVGSLASLSGLRIWLCHELWSRSKVWLGSGVAVAVT